MALPRFQFFSLLLSSLMLVIFAGNHNYQSAQHPIFDIDHKRMLLNHDQLLNDHNRQSKPEKYYYFEKPNPDGNKENIATAKLPSYGEQKSSVEGVVIPTNNKFIAIQGLILCNSGQKYVPLEGAKARITCESTKKKINKGYGKWPPTSFSIETDETDKNGLFLETFSLTYIQELKLNLDKCKVFLEAPPTESKCKVATDVNNGKIGARLSLLRILNDKILYTVGPFIYA